MMRKTLQLKTFLLFVGKRLSRLLRNKDSKAELWTLDAPLVGLPLNWHRFLMRLSALTCQMRLLQQRMKHWWKNMQTFPIRLSFWLEMLASSRNLWESSRWSLEVTWLTGFMILRLSWFRLQDFSKPTVSSSWHRLTVGSNSTHQRKSGSEVITKTESQ